MGTKRWVYRLRRTSGDKKVGLQAKEDQWGQKGGSTGQGGPVGTKRWVFRLRRNSGDKKVGLQAKEDQWGQKGGSTG